MLRQRSARRIQRAIARSDLSIFEVGNSRMPEIARTCKHILHNCGIPRVLRVSCCKSRNGNEKWPQVTGFSLRVASSCRDSRPTCLSLTNAAGGKHPVGRCKVCKATASQQEKALAEAQRILEENPDSFASVGKSLKIDSIMPHS
jgi:hypothetical protein